MEHFYGQKWDRILARGDIPAEVVPAAEATSATAAADALPVAAEVGGPGAGVGAMDTPQRGESATKESPESGMGLGDPGLNSPGSGRSASWKSASPGSPGSIRLRIMRDFVPGNMVLEQYESQLRRMAAVLETMPGESLQPGQLEVALERNRLISRMYEESGGDRALQNRLLSRELAAELLTIDNTVEQRYVIEAMEGLLTDRGVDVEEIRTAVVTGDAVAPTPEKPASPAPGEGLLADSRTATSFRAMSRQAQPREADADGLDGEQQAEIKELRRKLAIAELQKELETARVAESPQMVNVMEKQTALMEKLLESKSGGGEKPARSTIKVEPKVNFPTLGDQDTSGKAVEEFYEKFEDIISIMNDGRGMSNKEMMMVLKNCLSGSKKVVYENICKKVKAEVGDDENGNHIMYENIKKRLTRFKESALEKQLRVKREWKHLSKGGRTALAFEAVWEKVHAELEEVGLGESDLNKFFGIHREGQPA